MMYKTIIPKENKLELSLYTGSIEKTSFLPPLETLFRLYGMNIWLENVGVKFEPNGERTLFENVQAKQMISPSPMNAYTQLLEIKAQYGYDNFKSNVLLSGKKEKVNNIDNLVITLQLEKELKNRSSIGLSLRKTFGLDSIPKKLINEISEHFPEDQYQTLH